MAAQKLSLLEKLYAEKEFVDVKILCDERTFECHKNVLSCQREVFKTMIMNKSLNEKKTGIMEIEENDISSDIMEELLYYLYHEIYRGKYIPNYLNLCIFWCEFYM